MDWGLCGRVLQHHGQVIGKLARCQEQASGLVGLAQIDHGRATVSAVAVHVLEQMQRRAAAAVEELDVIGLHVQRPAARQAADECVQFSQTCRAECAFFAQRRLQFRQVGTQFGVWIAQQVGQHTQAHRHWLGRGGKEAHVQTPALMGMVRFFSVPKRLVSVTPSLHPLPKLKPQPPRTLKAFSAYSRCVVGMTKRSS